jgi:hypothetical protein
MAVKDYKGARELVMTKETREQVEKSVESLRTTILSYGFAKEAVDSLKFKVSEYILVIDDEERRSGAFHIFADLKPFHTIEVSAPGSIMNSMAGVGNATPPLQMTPQQQSVLLAFEIGMNLFMRVEDVMKQLGMPFNEAAEGGGGVSGDVYGGSYETQTRQDIQSYLGALNALLETRLNMIAPKSAPKRGPSAPKP